MNKAAYLKKEIAKTEAHLELLKEMLDLYEKNGMGQQPYGKTVVRRSARKEDIRKAFLALPYGEVFTCQDVFNAVKTDESYKTLRSTIIFWLRYFIENGEAKKVRHGVYLRIATQA